MKGKHLADQCSAGSASAPEVGDCSNSAIGEHPAQALHREGRLQADVEACTASSHAQYQGASLQSKTALQILRFQAGRLPASSLLMVIMLTRATKHTCDLDSTGWHIPP